MIPDNFKKYGRIALAIALVIGSLLVIFGVGGLAESQSQDTLVNQTTGPTTLEFGLQLEGGTRIQAPLHGITAENTDITTTETGQQERQIAERINGVDVTQVNIIREQTRNQTQIETHVEITSETVTKQALEQALQQESIEYETIRDGVTEETRQSTVTVVSDKINKAGLSGGTVRTVRAADGEQFLLIEVPGEDRENVLEVLRDQGNVRIDIYYPTDTGSYETRRAVLQQGDFRSIQPAQQSAQLGHHVPVTLTENAAQSFKQDAVETGLAPSGSACRYETAPNNTEACLLTLVDGEVVYSAGMSPSLARDIANGNWETRPSFVLQTEDYEEAQELALNLRAGALPTAIAFDEGTIVTITPTQGEKFKQGSFLVGLIALFAVAIKVYLRYRDIRVAAPMIAVSISEVTILSGFAALVGYPIDLAVVGGFIAVIGTGVDDLIIVANEILTKGEINSTRIFRDRFKKAFWVIGAAALTTFVALAPLVVLSLGQLSGFAIFTIIGIAIGVFITRPAYGDFLNYILIERNN